MDDDACTHYFKIFIAHVPPPCSTLFWTPPRRKRSCRRSDRAPASPLLLLLLPDGPRRPHDQASHLGLFMFRAIGDPCGPPALHHTPERNGWMLYNPAKDRASPFLVVGRRGATGRRAQALFLPPGRNKSDPLNLASETAREQFRRHHISSLNLPV